MKADPAILALIRPPRVLYRGFDWTQPASKLQPQRLSDRLLAAKIDIRKEAA